MNEMTEVADKHTDETVETASRPDFVAIATPLIQRNFRITPVHPETKGGVVRNWQNKQATTVEEVLAYAKYYPHHNVGVVGKRGIGRHCFLDIDADGVQARIEKREKIPQTYTVASRPQSKQYKKHFYFFQTEHSFQRFAQFGKTRNPWDAVNLNVRDLTRFEMSKAGVMMHPTLYDMKGVGGGSLVVGAGSVRAPENGKPAEIYTCIDDSPVTQIPDWLVDWICEDVRRYREAKDKEFAKKYAEKAAATRIAEEERKQLREKSKADGFDIAQDDIYEFLWWRVGQFIRLGVTDETELTVLLTGQVKRFCEKGDVFIASESGRRALQKVIGSALSNWHPGNATWFYRRKETKPRGLVVRARISKRDVMRNIIKDFANRISCQDAYARLRNGLAAKGFSWKASDAATLTKLRREIGFKVRGRWWVREHGEQARA